MTEQSPRLQRVADLIKRELAVLIQLEIDDPRIGMISVTGVDISRDLAHANVHVTVLNSPTGHHDEADAASDESSGRNSGVKPDQVAVAEPGAAPESGPENRLDQLEIDENIKALNKAAGYLRSLLAKRLKLRTTPKLRFHYDATMTRGNRLSSLIDDALEADRKLHS